MENLLSAAGFLHPDLDVLSDGGKRDDGEDDSISQSLKREKKQEQEEETQLLYTWYSHLRPHSVDIVGDFCGKELFAIHGEAMILHCLTTAKVDMTGGFQVLHAVFAVEKFLSDLKHRGCNIDIVFFDSQKSLCTPSEDLKYLERFSLIRLVIIQHLRRQSKAVMSSQSYPSDVRIKVFDHEESEFFRQYLAANSIHFFLCHEGFPQEEGLNRCRNFHVYRFLRSLVLKGYHVAFIGDIVFQSSKIFMSLISGSNVGLREAGPTSKPPPYFDPPELPLHFVAEPIPEISFREAVAIIACIMVLVGDNTYDLVKEYDTDRLIAAYLLHLAALRHCSLAERLCVEVEMMPREQECFQKFLDKLYLLTSRIISESPHNEFIRSQRWDIHDLLDGRLFASTYCLLGKSMTFPRQLHKWTVFLGECFETVLNQYPSSADADNVKETLFAAFPVSSASSRLDTTDPLQTNSNPIDTSVKHYASVLPFSHSIFDKHLKDIHVQSREQTLTPIRTPKVFEELTHWHNSQKPLDPRSVSQKKTFRAHRSHQKLMSDIVMYAASLTNAMGKNIDPEPISAVGYQTQGKQAQKQKKAGSGKTKGLESAHVIRMDKNEKRATAALGHWMTTVQELDREKSVAKRYAKTLRYLNDRSEEALQTLEPDVNLYLCHLLAGLWESYCSKAQKAQGLDILALLWNHLSRVPQMANCSIEIANAAQKMARHLKLPQLAEANKTISRALSCPTILQLSAQNVAAPVDGRTFQLEFTGPFMERNFDSKPDDRVRFYPDAWQRKVLDAIDANNSLFVVAPTSAGKTFISFYAMKKVLQSNDDEVLVYVAPTKALVNQIAAEVAARFTKTYKRDGRSIWAIHTRDYRINNPTGCQVLVTVPHILQIMLLSPSNADRPSAWSRRVKCIIFDEVHCIGQAQDGIIWEQLLLCAPCPIIALSATVGNPQEFYEWLETTQKARGHDLVMVVHNSRYSDLRKFIYRPPFEKIELGPVERLEALPLPGLDQGEQKNPRFRFIHPVAALLNCNQGHLDDVQLEPRDCFLLWESMKKHQTEEFPLDAALDPEKCLPEVIGKADVVQWESRLKRLLQHWMSVSDSPFALVQADLPGPGHSCLGDSAKTASETRETIIPLLYDLHKQNSLPALVFSYDRLKCEEAVRTMLQHLETRETEWKASSKEWARKMVEYSEWQKAQHKQSKTKPKKEKASAKDKSSRDEETTSKMVRLKEEASIEASPWETFDPDTPLSEFALGDHTKLSGNEFAELMGKVRRDKVAPWLVAALKRGLGVHHAGMNRRYRQIVEILFRKGYLGVVIATGTLALGINMPCKTVVFLGDSVFLSALNYRQASGRAGRRGFDLLGNVVFADIPPERVFEIMSSRLPDLRGNFAFSTTLVLRLFGLLHGTSNSEYAKATVASLISQSRLFLGGPQAQMAIKHHLRFSIEYLRRQHLLSETGAPLNFAGLVSHLYFTERAAFAFHALLKDGYFHRLCANTHRRPRAVLLELMLVLAHIFGRLDVPKSTFHQIKTESRKSPSLIVLPPMPSEARKVLLDHNTNTLNLFIEYARSYVSQHLPSIPSPELPFTKTRVGPEQSSGIVLPLETNSCPVIRSPFTALSGHTDETIRSVNDLCSTVRADVFLEESTIPQVAVEGERLNAYLYDFFKNGDLVALTRDNRLREAWFFLKDFSSVLATIVTSMTSFVRSGAFGEASDDVDSSGEDDDDVVPQPSVAKNPHVVGGHSKKKEKEKGGREQSKERNWDSDSSSENDGAISSDSPEEVVEDDCRHGANIPRDAQSWDWEQQTDHTSDPGSLLNVLEAFTMLQEEFDEKLNKIGA